MGRTLIAIISTTIEVIKLESETPFFASINSKECLKTIFSVGSITSGIIGKNRNRGEGRGKLKVPWLHDEHIIRIYEEEF